MLPVSIGTFCSSVLPHLAQKDRRTGKTRYKTATYLLHMLNYENTHPNIPVVQYNPHYQSHSLQEPNYPIRIFMNTTHYYVALGWMKDMNTKQRKVLVIDQIHPNIL